MSHPLAVLLAGWMLVQQQAAAIDLDASLSRAITNQIYRAPTRTELIRARELFRQTLADPGNAAERAAGWEPLGLDLVEVEVRGEALWLLSEPAGREGGRGWYLFRAHDATATVVQAPHAHNDRMTGSIGLRLFLDGRSRVFAAATITRHRADMAHVNDTFFQAFTLAFAEVCPTGTVIQLHGFSRRKHPAIEADAIVSNGTRQPDPWLADLTRELRNTASLRVLCYPQDTQELGGTLNAQGRALRRAGIDRFLHLEMSMDLRNRIRREQQLHDAVLRCLRTMNPE